MDSRLSLHEFKRRASFFFKEKIRTARLVFTDVTPAELLTEEAVDGDSRTLDARTIGLISRAAFEVDDYWRIVDILHKRLWKFDKMEWQASYKALILVEGLLTHGPKRVGEEFQCDKDVIWEMGSLKYVDEKGFNWGLTVRKKSERVLELLQNGSFLKEERDRVRKITCGLKGFGSFCERSLVGENLKDSTFGTYVRYNSHYNTQNQEDNNYISKKEYSSFGNIQQSRDENKFMARKPEKELSSGTSRPSGYTIEEDHPFCKDEQRIHASLISSDGYYLKTI